MLKKILSIILLYGLMACTNVGLADEIKLSEEYLGAFSGSEWEGYRASGWSIGEAYGFINMQKNGQNILCLIERQENNDWKIKGVNSRILHPGAVTMDDPLIQLWGEGLQEALYVCYSTPRHRGDSIGYSNWAEAYTFKRTEDGSWQLYAYTYETQSNAQLHLNQYDDLIKVRSQSARGDFMTYVVQTLDLDFESIDPAAINMFIFDLIDRRNEPPEIPSTGLKDALPQPQLISFPKGQSMNVYSGPGTQYTSWHLDTEAISEDIWMQIFGREDEWLLIQYPAGDMYHPFGYIPVSTLPAGMIAPILRFDRRPGVFKGGSPTYNPLRENLSYEDEFYLAGGTAIMCLATLGTNWTYIEAVTPDGAPFRGFVRSDDIDK